jgi:hypothetical protein
MASEQEMIDALTAIRAELREIVAFCHVILFLIAAGGLAACILMLLGPTK